MLRSVISRMSTWVEERASTSIMEGVIDGAADGVETRIVTQMLEEHGPFYDYMQMVITLPTAELRSELLNVSMI